MSEKFLWLIVLALTAASVGGWVWYVRRFSRLAHVGERFEALSGGRENASRLLMKAEEDANLTIAAGLSMGTFGMHRRDSAASRAKVPKAEAVLLLDGKEALIAWRLDWERTKSAPPSFTRDNCHLLNLWDVAGDLMLARGLTPQLGN